MLFVPTKGVLPFFIQHNPNSYTITVDLKSKSDCVEILRMFDDELLSSKIDTFGLRKHDVEKSMKM